MATDEGRRKARLAVAAEVAGKFGDATKLAAKADVHPQTVQALLNGTRWPALRTLGKLDVALGWPVGTLNAIGEESASETPEPETVGGPVHDDESTLMYERPKGLTDSEWAELKRTTGDYIEWQLNKLSQER